MTNGAEAVEETTAEMDIDPVSIWECDGWCELARATLNCFSVAPAEVSEDCD